MPAIKMRSCSGILMNALINSQKKALEAFPYGSETRNVLLEPLLPANAHLFSIDQYLLRMDECSQKLDVFEDRVAAWLEQYPALTATRLLEKLAGEGFTGGYTIVKDYVRQSKLGSREMFVPLRVTLLFLNSW